MPTPPRTPLGYAPAPTLRQRIKSRSGRLWVLGTLIVVAFAVHRWGPFLWTRAKFLHYQRLCMEYTPPANSIAYGEYPGALVVLPPDASCEVFDRAAAFGWRAAIPQLCVLRTSAPWTALEASDPRLKAVAPTRITPSKTGVAFLHARRSPAGNERLVCVKVETAPGSFELHGFAITPGTWNHDPSWSAGVYGCVQSDQAFGLHAMRLDVGRIDPADASHFTIDAHVGSRTETLDGWLRDDDTIELKPRQPAMATTPAPNPMWPPEWHLDDFARTLVECTQAESVLVPPGGNWDTQLLPFAPMPHGQRIAYSPDGKILAAVDGGRVILWDIAGTAQPRILEGEDGVVFWHVVFSPDGQLLAAGGGRPKAGANKQSWFPFEWTGDVNVWNVASGKRIHVLRNMLPSMAHLAFGPNAQTVLQPEYDVQTDLATGMRIDPLPLILGNQPVNFEQAMAKRIWLRMSSDNVDTSGWSGMDDLRIHFTNAAWSRDGQFTLSLYRERIDLGDSRTGSNIIRLIPPSFPPLSWCQISPTSGAMAAAQGYSQGNVYVWNLPSADTVWRLNCPKENYIAGLAFSPDGRRLAVANPPGPVLIWKLHDSLVKPASPVTKPAAR